jgi:lipopolysaccharide transport system permease protein
MSVEQQNAARQSSPETWDVIIKPANAGNLNLGLVWRYRELAWMFFKRDFSTFYKQTVLGPIWYLIQPLMTAMTYYVVFGKIANLSTDNLPPFVFYMSGTIIWNYFATCLTNNSETFSKNATLFGKVYFPRLVVPVAVAMSGIVAFAIQLTLLLFVTLVLWINGAAVTWNYYFIALTPLIVLYVAAAGVGAGLVVSALTVRYRDLVYVVGFMAQLWMYATPIVYPFSQIPEKYQWIYYFNPMTTPVQIFRWALLNAPSLPLSLVLSNVAATIVLMCCGLFLFARAEANAMDTV